MAGRRIPVSRISLGSGYVLRSVYELLDKILPMEPSDCVFSIVPLDIYCFAVIDHEAARRLNLIRRCRRVSFWDNNVSGPKQSVITEVVEKKLFQHEEKYFEFIFRVDQSNEFRGAYHLSE